MSPTARSLAVLREMGYTAEVVEQWIPKTRIRRDLFGVIDILAFHKEHGILGVQATTGSHHANRAVKARQEPRLLAWLAAGGRFEVWSWSMRGKRGEPKRWTMRRERVG